MGWLLQNGVPSRTSNAFIVLAVATVLAVHFLLLSRIRPASKGLKLTAGIFAWAAFQAFLAKSGFLIDHSSSKPPIVLIILLPNLSLLILLARHKAFQSAIKSLSPVWLVGLQAFRIPVEIILAQLAGHHLIPNVMSWHGRNFDVITGVTAPVVAWLIHKKKLKAPMIRAWNWMGLALLTNVVAHAVLTLPGIGVIETAVPNLLPSLFPFVWLPGILVPLAYALHIASLRQLGRK